MNLKDLKKLINEVMSEREQIQEVEYRTDKGFQPVQQSLMTALSSIEELRELSAGAIDQIFTIIYDDLN
jgi:hypothetical protein